MTLFQLMQFYYLVSGSARLTDRAERTALLMNRFFLCELDEQLERTRRNVRNVSHRLHPDVLGRFYNHMHAYRYDTISTH
ncbi:uncharacterized protein LOC120416190 isoform X2 [Culex pipiens pallens]|uniref:uncharacterized protein LOC120416190 isoform X2 n=1 Tax=Culex pipiens pallens TaxID=42434 RepID=UPI0019534137|nr:uncharacterized protein LOC120416190 isoform X2 [Culex pipiens pallens]